MERRQPNILFSRPITDKGEPAAVLGIWDKVGTGKSAARLARGKKTDRTIVVCRTGRAGFAAEAGAEPACG
jgi:hypothetical protein